MAFNFSFRQIDSTKDLVQLIDFLTKQALGYPKYEAWIQKAEHELDSEYKKAILAFSDSKIVGDVIYQPHKELPRTREVKNIRVHPEARNRYFANFMLKQAETENKEEYDALLVDTRTDLPEMITLLRCAGYQPLVKAPLYDSNTEDITMIKVLDKTSEQGILYSSKNLILSRSL